jgi:hypothetical protein
MSMAEDSMRESMAEDSMREDESSAMAEDSMREDELFDVHRSHGGMAAGWMREDKLLDDELLDVHVSHRSHGCCALPPAAAPPPAPRQAIPAPRQAIDDFALWLPKLVPVNPNTFGLHRTRPAGPLDDLEPLGTDEGARHYLDPIGFEGAIVPEYSTIAIAKEHRHFAAPRKPAAVDRVAMCKCFP